MRSETAGPRERTLTVLRMAGFLGSKVRHCCVSQEIYLFFFAVGVRMMSPLHGSVSEPRSSMFDADYSETKTLVGFIAGLDHPDRVNFDVLKQLR